MKCVTPGAEGARALLAHLRAAAIARRDGPERRLAVFATRPSLFAERNAHDGEIRASAAEMAALAAEN